MGDQLEFLLLLLLAVALLALWLGALRVIFHLLGWPRFWSVAFQISVIAVVCGALTGLHELTPIAVLMPWIFIPALGEQLAAFDDLTIAIFPYAFAAGGAAALISVIVRLLRPWVVTIAFVVAAFAGVLVGDRVSTYWMCLRASEIGARHIERRSFIESLFRDPFSHISRAHAMAVDADGQRYIWSYRQMAWIAYRNARVGADYRTRFDCGENQRM